MTIKTNDIGQKEELQGSKEKKNLKGKTNLLKKISKKIPSRGPLFKRIKR